MSPARPPLYVTGTATLPDKTVAPAIRWRTGRVTIQTLAGDWMPADKGTAATFTEHTTPAGDTSRPPRA